MTDPEENLVFRHKIDNRQPLFQKVVNVMYLIVGLGNPGMKYAKTRHNAGFRTLDLIAGRMRASDWQTSCGSLVSRGSYRGQDLILAKPQSYMNSSGAAVSRLLSQEGLFSSQMLVVYDDLDIDSGKIRVKFGGGHAGHNGLRSVIERCHTADFFRLRIGIGRPSDGLDTVDYVLGRPQGNLADDLAYAEDLASLAALDLIELGLEKTQQKYN